MMVVSCLVRKSLGFSPTFNSYSSLYTSQQQRASFKSQARQRTHIIGMSTYGKDAEIWPETNLERIRLEDTFPDKQVQAIVDRMIRITKSNSDSSTSLSFHKNDKMFMTIALSLVSLRLVSFVEVFFAVAFSSYLYLLSWWNTAMAKSGSVIIPSRPPQGHVPAMVSNPLGNVFSKSPLYRLWLQLGVSGGFILPVLFALWYIGFKKDAVAASLVAKPLFLICAQAISESFAKRVSGINNIHFML